MQKAELPLHCANTIPKVQTEIYPSTFLLLALLLWEMTQGGIQEAREHSGQSSHFSLFQDFSSHALERGAHNTLCTFTGGPQDWHITAATKQQNTLSVS